VISGALPDPSTFTIPNDVWTLLGTALIIGYLIFETWDRRQSAKAQTAQQEHNAQRIEEVHDQVHNRHPPDTNLREDVDGLTHKLDRVLIQQQQVILRQNEQTKDVREIHKDIGGIREELRENRRSSSELERRVNRCEHQHPQLPPPAD
jgi:hypothetical protein